MSNPSTNTLLEQVLPLFKTPTPADLGPKGRESTLTVQSLTADLDRIFADTSLDRRSRNLTQSLLLLWHDHLDESHTLSKNIDGADGSFVHGIMHRREPDYGNAAYWFRRVGNHAAFDEIARRVKSLLHSLDPDLEGTLLPGGRWGPYAFIEACRTAASQSHSETDLLRQVQRIETEVLLERFFEQ
jgi:hypothetical protein